MQSPIPSIGVAGILESKNVPRFAQMVGSKEINGDVWIGSGHSDISVFSHAVRFIESINTKS